jgi:hypothetical protein
MLVIVVNYLIFSKFSGSGGNFSDSGPLFSVSSQVRGLLDILSLWATPTYRIRSPAAGMVLCPSVYASIFDAICQAKFLRQFLAAKSNGQTVEIREGPCQEAPR